MIKRDVMEGDKADEAKKKITRCANKLLRAANPKEKSSSHPHLAEDIAADQASVPEVEALLDIPSASS